MRFQKGLRVSLMGKTAGDALVTWGVALCWVLGAGLCGCETPRAGQKAAPPRVSPPTAKAPSARSVWPTPVPAPARPATKAEPKPAARPARKAPAAAAAEAWRRRRATWARRYPPAAAAWVDRFERKQPDWRAASWGNPATLETVERDGEKMLHIVARPGASDKVALIKTIGMDLTSRRRVTVEVHNVGKTPVGVALAVTTDEWYETPPQKVAGGERKTLTFDLRATDFKAKSGNWTHTVGVKRLERPKSIALLFYTTKGGEFYVDNLRLLKAQ